MIILKLFISILIFFLAGCGGFLGPIQTYDGDRLPDSAVAKVVIRKYTTGYQPRESYGQVNNVFIDDKRVSSFFMSGDKSDKELQILPGNKKIGVEYEWGDNNCHTIYSGPSAGQQSCSPYPKGRVLCNLTLKLLPKIDYTIEMTRNYDEGPNSVDIEARYSGVEKILSKGSCRPS
jgi:hypothetical protein